MECPKCGNEIDSQATYCPYCGQTIQSAQSQSSSGYGRSDYGSGYGSGSSDYSSGRSSYSSGRSGYGSDSSGYSSGSSDYGTGGSDYSSGYSRGQNGGYAGSGSGYQNSGYPSRTQPAVVSARDLPPEYRPMSAWGYFGWSILFAIPIVGFILIIVFSCVRGNINRRSFARSYLCWWLILGIIIAIFLITGLATFNGLLSGQYIHFNF